MSALSVQGLAFTYTSGGDELFDGLSHEFAPGKITAVTGPSGRGKSTLLYVLGLMLTPSRGEVRIQGEAVSSAPDAARSGIRAAMLGFVFQDAALDPSRSVLDSVMEPSLYAGRTRRDSLERARQLLDELGVGARADHRPGQISGGQAQRVAVARALMNNPAVILADEPTGNLDPSNAEGVIDILSKAAGSQQRTVVIATHDPYVIRRSDEVLSL
ncbi:ABC transporter ATP-binding protein [Galactobacter caseinivorans]|uniref:ABC transporter ATP-binding protein n=1 Tax=Galactobacter caseinivorans TaxID=2676123 RepID=A0A496PLZ7_9MICC|nr:ABC transporter ATP-binding protein [Galactobacter caseinivorans]RKW71560.1 ABC transporter ATP-binding protein [Galactobacter caseinivorans]